jgi:hypothetical protein
MATWGPTSETAKTAEQHASALDYFVSKTNELQILYEPMLYSSLKMTIQIKSQMKRRVNRVKPSGLVCI